MRTIIYCAILPLSLLIFDSCSGDQNTIENPDGDSTDLVCIMPAPNRMDELSWMLGVWENESEVTNIVSTESWVKTNEELFSGISYAIEDGDTAFYETIEIRHESTGLVYSPTVKDQNDGEAVDFLLVNLNDSVVEFENYQHDFPQRIVYRRFGDDSMAATISGEIDKHTVSEVFPMKRVK